MGRRIASEGALRIELDADGAGVGGALAEATDEAEHAAADAVSSATDGLANAIDAV
jgi:hypothetical protein